MDYGRLKGLKVEDYQHPGEVIYMKTLKSIPLFDKLMTYTIEASNQFNTQSDLISNCCRITNKTNKRVYKLYETALERLDMPEEYPLYAKLAYEYNAFASGTKHPVVCVHTSELNDDTDEELLTTIGHELGHIKSQHMLYHNMASILKSYIATNNLIGQTAAIALSFALMQWSRCSEYTADRAGMIASADYNANISIWERMMGLTEEIQCIDCTLEEILKQSDDFDIETADIVGKLLYANFTASADHPWHIQRIKQLNDWYQSGDFQMIVNNYSGI